MSKEKPTNIAASVRGRLKNLSKQRGLDFGLVLVSGDAGSHVIEPAHAPYLNKISIFDIIHAC